MDYLAVRLAVRLVARLDLASPRLDALTPNRARLALVLVPREQHRAAPQGEGPEYQNADPVGPYWVFVSVAAPTWGPRMLHKTWLRRHCDTRSVRIRSLTPPH